jgi:putative membrane protein (TIGR04086 family)
MKGKDFSRSIYLGKGLLLAFIMTLVLILTSSLLLTFTSMKEGRMDLLNTIVMIISITTGSIYVAGKVKEKGWINGGILGISYYLILLMFSFVLLKPFTLDVFSITKLLLTAITGIIGGIIGINIS